MLEERDDEGDGNEGTTSGDDARPSFGGAILAMAGREGWRLRTMAAANQALSQILWAPTATCPKKVGQTTPKHARRPP